MNKVFITFNEQYYDRDIDAGNLQYSKDCNRIDIKNVLQVEFNKLGEVKITYASIDNTDEPDIYREDINSIKRIVTY